MNAELKAKWVAALRSGEYRQGQGVLKTSKGEYCCLGVLCDIRGIELDPDADHGSLYDSFLALGVSWGAFVSMNDTNGLTFNEIADHIEKTL